MARSTYVYVLSQYGTVFGCATVKYELANWVANNIPSHLYSEYKVTRYRDGKFGVSVDPVLNLKDWMEAR